MRRAQFGEKYQCFWDLVFYNMFILEILTRLLSLLTCPPPNLHILKGRDGGGEGENGKQSLSFDGLKKEKMFVPLTDWLMNNQISQLECWGGNLVARHAPNPWNSASLM